MITFLRARLARLHLRWTLLWHPARLYFGWGKGGGAASRAKVMDFVRGVAVAPCPECGGSGWWDFGPTEAESGPCVDCKGTGRRFVGA